MKNTSPLKTELKIIRDKWRKTRDERLKLKTELLSEGLSKTKIIHEKSYKRLRKEQRHFSKMIKHMEMRLNKIISKPDDDRTKY